MDVNGKTKHLNGYSLTSENNANKKENEQDKVNHTKDRLHLDKPLSSVANMDNGINNNKSQNNFESSKSNRSTNKFMNKVRNKNDLAINNVDYFSFASPDRDKDKENGNFHQNRTKTTYPESELYPSVVYSNEAKYEANLNSNARLKGTFLDSNINKSMKSAFEYNSNEQLQLDEPTNNYMLFNNQEKYSNTVFRYTDTNSNTFKERASKLNRDLNSGAFKDKMKLDFIKNSNIINNAKRSTYKNEIQSEEDLYQYKKKRGSSLQRFKESENVKASENVAQRRSYNNPQNHFEDNQSIQNNEGRSENLIMNTILKENIKK